MRLIDGDELLTAFPVDDEPMLTKSCVRMTIQHMPTVDAVPVKHGRWLRVGYIENTWLVSECSACGYQTIDAGNYCTNCGAKMAERREGDGDGTD